MATISIASWNINSVRLRADLVARLVGQRSPDVICLQETKCGNDHFPRSVFSELGYSAIALNGQKGYHGVAVLSRLPIHDTFSRPFCGIGDARHVAVDVVAPGATRLRIHNFYVPSGGDIPDPALNPKFAHKLAFLDEMIDWFGRSPDEAGLGNNAVLLGDLNIAPLPEDVWSHRQLLDVVSHTPVETEGLERMREAGGWVDAVRAAIPPPQRLYTWWSYRARDWAASDRGRRLDHIWLTPPLSGRVRSVEILRQARGWERPSDHVPVMVTLEA